MEEKKNNYRKILTTEMKKDEKLLELKEGHLKILIEKYNNKAVKTEKTNN